MQRLLCAIIATWGAAASPSLAAEWKDRGEAEGKLVLYSTSNTADAKAVTDGFKRLHPKIDVQFDRTTDSQLMEKILNESRAGKPLWDVVSTTGYYGYLLKKRGLLAAYDSPERKYFRDGFKDPQGFWTSDLHHLRSLRLQYPAGAQDRRTTHSRRSFEAGMEKSGWDGRTRL